MATPYDGKVAVWHWRGDYIAEDTIDEVVATFKGWAPNVKAIWVKTSDGTNWMGKWDKSDMAINGPDDVVRWVKTLERHGIEFHAWCVVRGVNITEEAQRVIDVCLVPGVKSMILDVEPYAEFWQGSKEDVRRLMEAVRRAVPGEFHIGMSVDPRSQHFKAIYPEEWWPFVNSIHPQVYWRTFGVSAREALAEAYRVWGDYGRPIYPVLQANVDADSLEEARKIAIGEFDAKGLSYWRFGVIGPAQFPVINRGLGGVSPEEPEEPEEGEAEFVEGFGQVIVVRNGDPTYRSGVHTGENPDAVWKTDQNYWGWTFHYKETEPLRSSVWARWDPRLPEPGFYEVSVFVPAKHATTRRARYKLHGVIGQDGELVTPVDQNSRGDLWVPLGIFRFDPTQNPVAGVVFLNDLTGEDDEEIAFDALRWRQIVGFEPVERYMADGYDAPIGTFEERATDQVWPGHWVDATGYAALYRGGTQYHTGADLNLNKPYWDADRHSPVYAAAHGVVTFAGELRGWGNVIVIRHDPLVGTGQVMYGRYAHVENVRVTEGQRVVRGEQIANVGDAGGLYPYHLHFDLSPTDILESKPWHWPRDDLNAVHTHYVDPRDFILKHRPPMR